MNNYKYLNGPPVINCFGCYWTSDCYDFMKKYEIIICRVREIDDFLNSLIRKYGIDIDEK